MTFLLRPPAPPLDRSIEALWYCRRARQPFALERVMPTGAAQLIVNLTHDETRSYDLKARPTTASGSVLVGPRTTFEIIDSDEQEHVVAAIFRPGGTRALFAPPADELAAADVPLEALWSPAATACLRERLLEAPSALAALEVLERALLDTWHDRPPHPAVTAALATFAREPHTAKVTDVAGMVGLTSRRFIDAFRREVGLTPKQFCRVRRFQQALRQAHAEVEVDWADVALSCGYYDQAHFIHDFRAFSGLTPTGYRAGRTAFHNHVAFLQYAGG